MCGCADVEDLVGRAGLDELLQHLAAEEARVLDLAVELAVGEGAGAALAELHVATRGSSTFLRHRPQVSLVRWRTALPRSSTIGRKPICASMRPANSRTARCRSPPGGRRLRARPRRQRMAHGRRGLDAADGRRAARAARLFALRVGDTCMDHRSWPCAHRSCACRWWRRSPRADLEGAGDQHGQRLGRMVERKFEFGDSQHVVGLCLSSRPTIYAPGRQCWIAGRNGSARGDQAGRKPSTDR